MNLPSYPQPGQPVRAEWGRAVIDYLRSLTPRGSTTVLTQHLPGGVTYSVKLGQGGSASADHPYTGKDASEGDTPKVEVTPGTHNGKVPTIDGVPITDDPRPKLTLGAEAKIVYAQLNLNVSNPSVVDSVSINSSNEIEAPDDEDFTVYQILFFVTMEEGKIKEISDNVTGSQIFQRCGDQSLFGVI